MKTYEGDTGGCKSCSTATNIKMHSMTVVDSTSNYACDAMILGTLTKSLIEHKLWPLPAKPYNKLSAMETAPKIKSLHIMSLQDLFLPKRVGVIRASFAHGLCDGLNRSVNSIVESLNGIDLKAKSARAGSKRSHSSIWHDGIAFLCRYCSP